MDLIIKTLIYLLWLLSFYMVFEDIFIDVIKDINGMLKYKKRKNNKIFEYIKNIFRTLDEDNKDDKELQNITYKFFFQSSFLFLVSFLVSFMFQIQSIFFLKALFFSLIFGLCIGFIPFIFQYIKLWKLRVESSKEAITLLNELINQYKINNENIIEALDQTYYELKEDMKTKRFILRLTMRLKERKNDKELDEILDEFVFTVDTNWIKMLAHNIRFNLKNKISMTIGMEDILTQLKLSNENKNFADRLNNESFKIVNILAPFIYISTVYLSVKKLGIPLNRYLKYQFSGTGLMLLFSIIFLYVLSKILIYVYKNQKFDF